jgi:hypothetical protein
MAGNNDRIMHPQRPMLLLNARQNRWYRRKRVHFQ